MASVKIKTPKATNIANAGRLEWHPSFATTRNNQIKRAQMFIDNEVLHLCSFRVPKVTGMLEKSGTLGTTIGSGEVCYIAPYAAFQYYSTAETRSYNPQRGAKWFERMKVSCKDQILRGAAQYVKRGM